MGVYANLLYSKLNVGTHCMLNNQKKKLFIDI